MFSTSAPSAERPAGRRPPYYLGFVAALITLVWTHSIAFADDTQNQLVGFCGISPEASPAPKGAIYTASEPEDLPTLTEDTAPHSVVRQSR